MNRKKKMFDAVQMVREIRNEHHETLKDKSWQERVKFTKKKRAPSDRKRKRKMRKNNKLLQPTRGL